MIDQFRLTYADSANMLFLFDTYQQLSVNDLVKSGCFYKFWASYVNLIPLQRFD